MKFESNKSSWKEIEEVEKNKENLKAIENFKPS